MSSPRWRTWWVPPRSPCRTWASSATAATGHGCCWRSYETSREPCRSGTSGRGIPNYSLHSRAIECSVGVETRSAEIKTRQSPIDFVHSSRPRLRRGKVKIKTGLDPNTDWILKPNTCFRWTNNCSRAIFLLELNTYFSLPLEVFICSVQNMSREKKMSKESRDRCSNPKFDYWPHLIGIS